MREGTCGREMVELWKLGGAEELWKLGEVEAEESMVIIFCKGEESIFNKCSFQKRKEKQSRKAEASFKSLICSGNCSKNLKF